ncbi:hypothetical protein ACF3NG_08630 [Aerococcaceae bacterium WGS1372]
MTEKALFDYDLEESLVSRAFIQMSDQSIILLDHSKINQRKLVEISAVEDIDIAICDVAKPKDWGKVDIDWVIA